MLVGTPRLDEAIPSALDGLAWAKLIVVGTQLPDASVNSCFEDRYGLLRRPRLIA